MSKIITKWITNAAVTNAKLNADVAGNGISGGAGSALAVNPDTTTGGNYAAVNVAANGVSILVDGSTLENNSNTLRVKAGGIDTNELAADAVDNTILDLAGTYDFNSGGGTVRVATPSNDNDAVTKIYVDNIAQGFIMKDSARVGTAAALPACTYDNGTDGVGATLTADANGSLNDTGIDGKTDLATTQRILVKNQVAGLQNGIYELTTVGDESNPWVLTRTTDADVGTELKGGIAIFINEGTTNEDTGWVCTTDGTVTIGTTAIAFTQFNGATGIVAGDGLDKTGNTLSITELANSAISVETDGVSVSVDDSTLEIAAGTPGQLQIKALGVDTAELAATSVTAAKLGSDVTGNGLTGGNGSAIAALSDTTTGGNYAAVNVAANGLSVQVDGSTLENNSNVMRIKAGGVDTNELAADAVDATILDLSATYDFASGGGTVQVTTQSQSDNSTKAASTAYVDTAVSGMSSENVKQEMHIVTSGEVTAGYFTLAENPVNAQSVRVTPQGGPMQVNKQVVGATGATPDFDVLSTNQVHINNNGAASGLSEEIEENDILVIEYQY